MEFFESKLRIPYYTPYLVRERLFSVIEKNLDRSLICVTSDGGYGKTTLISSFIKENNIPAIWYQLSHLDRDPQTFLSYFKTAIFRHISGELSVYNIPREKVESELNNIITILSTWPKKLVIVLDNYQSINECEEIESMLTAIIKHVSPNVTFIITSRIRPNLELVHLKLQNRLVELRTHHLAFTKDELEKFFVQLHHIHLQKDEIELVLHKTEGWAASLQLLQELIKDMEIPARPFFWLKFRGTPDIYDYLGSEILASETEEIKTFLYKTCLFSELNADIINQFLAFTNSEQILKHLLENHLFIYKNEFGTIKYHTIFRSFLYKKLSEYSTKSEIYSLHRQISSIYEQRRQHFFAFGHSLAGQDFLLGAKLMSNMRRQYDSSQFLTLMDGLLEESSPEGFSAASMSLYLIRCMPLEINKDLITPLEKKINDTKDTNSLLLSNLQHMLGGLYFYTGNINKAEQLCNDSLSHSIKNKDQELISINLSLKALILWYKGNNEKAIQLAKQAISYPDKNGTFHPHHIATWVLSEIYLDQNELAKGESLLTETLKLSEQRYDCSIIYPYCSMGKYHRLKGELKEALDWIKKAESLGLEFNIEYDLGWIYYQLALTYFEAKDFTEAELNLSKSLTYLLHSDYLKCHVVMLQIRILKELGNLTLVADLQKQLDDSIREMNFFWLQQDAKTAIPDPIRIKEKKRKSDRLFLYTLGNFEIKYEDKPISLKRKSSLQLLQYFIANRNKKINKESLIDQVFPDGSFDSVKNQFYVSLSDLRKSIEPGLKTRKDSSFIKRNMEHYSLCLDYVYLDVDDFTRMIEQKSGATKLERMDQLLKAEQLYRGDFFEGYPYHEFLEEERERLRLLFISTLQELADYYWENKDYKLGIEYYEKILKKEPYNETIYIDYIKQLLNGNFFLQAKKVSEQYKTFIENELGIPVDEKVQTIFQIYNQSS
ncbi:BTAD domain-containing putative transcriptional regulator [Neobacillus muris]|uniref:BTAD domain-containing putative transcriptional regulator n=1 Tax=Neobacillus muris TaxID=2941334 RepID=UPI00203E8C9C|nr:BTAD domain-containing putative transcriptional regulator [Neobacillus muris]